jgi:hypothetical protein
MDTMVPAHIQQQFLSIIQILNEHIGQDATRAYLKSLCTDASLDSLLGKPYRSKSPLEKQHPSTTPPNEEDIWRTFTSLYDDGVAYERSCLDTPESVSRLSISSPETSFLTSSFPLAENKHTTLCQRCTCKGCRKPKMNKKMEGNSCISDSVIGGFLRPRLLEFLSEYWETLKVNGLYYHESAQSFRWTLRDSPMHVRRLHYHIILEHLGIEDDLYQWRRSIAEINNLRSYNAFIAEAEDQMTQVQRTRGNGETNSQKAHKEYLAYIYTDRTPKDFDKARQALKKNLEFGRRWSILVDGYIDESELAMPGLGPGVLLLCGPSIKKKMSTPMVF